MVNGCIKYAQKVQGSKTYFHFSHFSKAHTHLSKKYHSFNPKFPSLYVTPQLLYDFGFCALDVPDGHPYVFIDFVLIMLIYE